MSDEEDRCSDEEYAEAYKEWLWLKEQEGLPAHKREGYAERMYEQADMKRKEIRESK